MPITRKQFELGIDPIIERWMVEIYDFFAKHKDEAFTAEELKNQLKDQRAWSAAENRAVNEALDKLIYLGAVEGRKVKEKSYYSLGRMPLEI